MVVEADDLPDRLDRASMDRLATLPAVVMARTSHLTAAGMGRPGGSAGRSAGRHGHHVWLRPGRLATTVLTLLLRTGGGRTVPEGLVAESTAYGLLQAGPEFTRWRASRPARLRPEADRPPVRVERPATS